MPRAVIVFPPMAQSESAACVCVMCWCGGSLGRDCAPPCMAQSEAIDRGAWRVASSFASGCDCVSPHGTKKKRKKGFFSRDVPGVSQEEKPTACEKNCSVHGNGLLSAQKEGPFQKKDSTEETK